jgi:hypothetical protein
LFLRYHHSSAPLLLTLEQKYKVASEEMDALNEDIEQTKKTSEQNIDILKVLLYKNQRFHFGSLFSLFFRL